MTDIRGKYWIPRLCQLVNVLEKSDMDTYDSIPYFFEKAFPVLNPQSAIFGFTDVLDQNYLLVNHLLIIFKSIRRHPSCFTYSEIRGFWLW